jgi:hypothetical protein
VAAFILFRVAINMFLPITQDEAYYVAWTKHLALGYFDHPPLVAFGSALTQILGTSFFIARFGALVSLVVGGVLLRHLAKRLLPGRELAVCSLYFCSFAGMAFGTLTIPDTFATCGWIGAILAATIALEGRPKMWLAAGAWTGMALLGKYTSVLLGPIFLIGLIRGKGLRSPWPYLGGVVALIVFLPHLWWQAENNWVTFRFQFAHGFGGDRGSAQVTSEFPTTTLATDPSYRLRKPSVKPKVEKTFVEESWDRSSAFWGAQLGFWGATAFLLPMMRRKRLPAWPPATAALITAATLIPPLGFGLLAVFRHVEANWSMMYCVSGAVLFTALLPESRWLWRLALLNLLLIFVATVHAAMPLRAKPDRIIAETHGYRDLAQALTAETTPIFADTYQITAMLNFYGATVHQWPGITRPSEFTRDKKWLPPALAATLANGFLLVLNDQETAPFIEGFQLVEARKAVDCQRLPLAITGNDAPPDCKKPVHVWNLIRYTGLSKND